MQVHVTHFRASALLRAGVAARPAPFSFAWSPGYSDGATNQVCAEVFDHRAESHPDIRATALLRAGVVSVVARSIQFT